MKNLKIINIGKFFFWISFILSNIFMFGYIFTHDIDFAYYGFGSLLYVGLANLLVISGLLLYSFYFQTQYKDCVKACLIMFINVPIALLYAWIGLSIL